MYKQINSLLKEHEGTKISKQFVSDALDIMISGLGLNDTVKELSFNDTELRASFNFSGRKINYSERELLRTCDDNKKRLEALYILRHECEHAIGYRNLLEGKGGLETAIVSYSLAGIAVSDDIDIPLLTNNSGYSTYYEIDPGERIADIRAAKFMINLLKNKRKSEDLQLSREDLYKSFIRGYHDNGVYLEAPTYTYLLNMRLLDELEIIKFMVESSKLSLEKRALLGLPITYEERDRELLYKAGLKRPKNSQ